MSVDDGRDSRCKKRKKGGKEGEYVEPTAASTVRNLGALVNSLSFDRMY
jgi:hypothetical protein